MTLYPIITDDRRRMVQRFSDYAQAIDAEAEARHGGGSWNATVRDELQRAAGTIRLVATLIVNGSMTDRKAKFWLKATADYLALVRRADSRGVIQ